MSASVDDVFKKTGASTVTTLSAPGKALSATSINVGSTTNYPADTGFVIAIREVDSSGELVAGTYREYNAIVASGTSLNINATPVYGSDRVFPAGSTTQVFIPLSSSAHNQLVDGVLVQHKQDGTHTDTITTDTINENTSANGVTIDGLNIKDSKLVTANSVVTANITDASVTSEKLSATIAMRAYRDAAQTIEVGTETVIFDVENFDVGSNYNTTTGLFTAPVTGYYQVNATAQIINVNAGGDQVLIYIYVNSVLYSSGNNLYAQAAGDDPKVHVSDLVFCTAGQTIETRIQNASSATESLGTGTSNSFMSIYLVGAA